jgi:hypothetical protein
VAIQKYIIGLIPSLFKKTKCRVELATLEIKVRGQRSMMISSPFERSRSQDMTRVSNSEKAIEVYKTQTFEKKKTP